MVNVIFSDVLIEMSSSQDPSQEQNTLKQKAENAMAQIEAQYAVASAPTGGRRKHSRKRSTHRKRSHKRKHKRSHKRRH